MNLGHSDQINTVTVNVLIRCLFAVRKAASATCRSRTRTQVKPVWTMLNDAVWTCRSRSQLSCSFISQGASGTLSSASGYVNRSVAELWAAERIFTTETPPSPCRSGSILIGYWSADEFPGHQLLNTDNPE